MLKRYEKFISDLLLENIINESYIYYSPPLAKTLNRIDNEIAKDLISIESTDIKPDITFVDIDNEGYLSFTTARNASNNLEKNWPRKSEIGTLDKWFKKALSGYDLDVIWSKYDRNRDIESVYNRSRNSIKLGKFINKVFPGKYTDKEIEEFVNIFKSKQSPIEKFELIEGDLIKFWYKSENYSEIKGQLGNSCMKDSDSEIFEIYSKNPEVCKMLILLEDNKLIGRSLIWKLNTIKSYGREFKEDIYFMDRQYTIKESDVNKFRSYAKENDWIYKTNNNHHSLENVTYNSEEFRAEMTVSIKNLSYSKFPYMDTFRRYSRENGSVSLINDDNGDKEGDFILAQTDGGYTEVESGVYSEYHGVIIPEDNAIWSGVISSYIYDSETIEITTGSRHNWGYYPENYDDIVRDRWNNRWGYIHISDAIWSDSYNHYILKSESVYAICEVYEDGSTDDVKDNVFHIEDDQILNIEEVKDTIWFKKLSETHEEWINYNYIHKSLLIKNHLDNLVLRKFITYVQKIGNELPNAIDLMGVKLLNRLDAEVLGYEVVGELLIMDKFEYYVMIQNIINKLLDRLNLEVNRIKGKPELNYKYKYFVKRIETLESSS
jgi:hypothetical protein